MANKYLGWLVVACFIFMGALLNSGSEVNSESSPMLQDAFENIFESYGDSVSVRQKSKDLNKFGINPDIDAGDTETVMELQGAETDETYVATNLITHLVCSDAGNTMEFKIEGHTCSGNDKTFVVQTKSATGQTGIALDTALCRATRIFNNSGTNMAASSTCYVYEGGATTSGVPNTASETHLLITAAYEQSLKAATSLSQYDYWIVSGWNCGVNKNATASVDCFLEVREPGGVYRVRDILSVASTGSTFAQEDFNPYFIIPKNSDVRVRATSGAANASVRAGIHGYLACIKGSAGCNAID